MIGKLEVLAFPVGGMGNVSAAEAAAQVINVWNPSHIILTGIAGGIQDAGAELSLGDVLIADQVVGYELAKIRPDGTERRYQVLPPDWELLQTAHSLDPREWSMRITVPRPDGQGRRVVPRALFGPVLSGEKVLADATTMSGLRAVWTTIVPLEVVSTKPVGVHTSLREFRVCAALPVRHYHQLRALVRLCA
jgi:nucleoside phosphorylase